MPVSFLSPRTPRPSSLPLASVSIQWMLGVYWFGLQSVPDSWAAVGAVVKPLRVGVRDAQVGRRTENRRWPAAEPVLPVAV